MSGTAVPGAGPERDAWLKERVKYWQSLLRLDDWIVIPTWVWPNELEGDEHANARVSVDFPSKHARLQVRRPEAIDPLPDVVAVDPLSIDVEVFVVHELLHLSMADMDLAVPEEIDMPGTLYQLGQERHVINVSKLLVMYDRAVNRGLPLQGIRSSAADSAGIIQGAST